MKIINLKGIVGYDLTAESVTELLAPLNGEDITVNLFTQGGDVYEGLEIYRIFKDYTGRKTVRYGGLVASAGSFIVMAFDERIALSISIMFIHNAQGFEVGDYRDLQKEATVLEAHSKHIANVTAEVTGRTAEEITSMMDADTFLYGNEIVEAGLADVLEDAAVEGETVKEKDEIIEMRRLQIKEAREAHKRAASFKYMKTTHRDSVGDKNNTEGDDDMTEKELLGNIQLMLSQGDTSKKAILALLGAEELTPEHKSALSVVTNLKEAGIEKVEDVKALQDKIEADAEKVRTASLDHAFGVDADGKNLLRAYADKTLSADFTDEDVTKLKEDPIAMSLAAEAVDYSSDINKVGTIENKKKDSGDVNKPDVFEA